MKLLKVGDRYINMDLVTDIRVSDNTVEVFLAVTPTSNPALTGGSVPGPNNIMQGVRALTFQDDDAKTLQQWLDQNAESVQSEAPEFRPATAGSRSIGRGVRQGSTRRRQ